MEKKKPNVVAQTLGQEEMKGVYFQHNVLFISVCKNQRGTSSPTSQARFSNLWPVWLPVMQMLDYLFAFSPPPKGLQKEKKNHKLIPSYSKLLFLTYSPFSLS